MKKWYLKFISTNFPTIENDEEIPLSDNERLQDSELFKEDQLREMFRHEKKELERFIMLAGKLIAPILDGVGFDWVVENLKSTKHVEIASELEIAKAIQYLKEKDFEKSIQVLKEFEKKDHKSMGIAAANLSFLYLLENDYKSAEKYAEIAINADRYNSKALTNRGNCYHFRGNFFLSLIINNC